MGFYSRYAALGLRDYVKYKEVISNYLKRYMHYTFPNIFLFKKGATISVYIFCYISINGSAKIKI